MIASGRCFLTVLSHLEPKDCGSNGEQNYAPTRAALWVPWKKNYTITADCFQLLRVQPQPKLLQTGYAGLFVLISLVESR